MPYLISVVAYSATVFAWALVWNLLLFHDRYQALAGEFLRQPPLFISGITAILVEAAVVSVAFALFYPKGQLRPLQALLIAALVKAGSVTFGAFVIPGKFNIGNVAEWIVLELSYGVIATCLIALSMGLVWSRVEEKPQGEASGL